MYSLSSTSNSEERVNLVNAADPSHASVVAGSTKFVQSPRRDVGNQSRYTAKT